MRTENTGSTPHHATSAVSTVARDALRAMHIANAQADLDEAHRALLENVLQLRDRLTRFAADLEQEGVGAFIDALGIVKELGVEVDRMCAGLAFAQEKRVLVTMLAGGPG